MAPGLTGLRARAEASAVYPDGPAGVFAFSGSFADAVFHFIPNMVTFFAIAANLIAGARRSSPTASMIASARRLPA